MTPPRTTDVIIVGAGPTGLSLACQCVRHGLDFVIIDRHAGITPYSKAIGVQARTLEIYEQLGLAADAVAQGALAVRGRLLVCGRIRGELEFGAIGKGMSPYPYVLLLEQSKNERLLYDYIRHSGKDVFWNTELERLSQTAESVTAHVNTSDGSSQAIAGKYLAGCDGAKSPTRHALGLAFEGSTFERMFFVADAQVDWEFTHDALHVCLAPSTFVVFFPLPGERRYRIVGVFPEEFAGDEGEVLYEEIEQRIKGEAGIRLDIHHVEWFSTYKVHTPAGAQGMNTGIQDAYNLAWKLRLVVRDDAAPAILDTYNEERLANATNLLRTTDRFFQFVSGAHPVVSFFRLHVFPIVANRLTRLDAVRRRFFPTLSQIGINYRRSSLSEHGGDDRFTVKAGDRMPYLLIDGRSIYDSLHGAAFHWIVFSDKERSRSVREFDSRYQSLVDVNQFPLTRDVAGAFGTTAPFGVLLRPDNYVGCISPGTGDDSAVAYLDQLVAK